MSASTSEPLGIGTDRSYWRTWADPYYTAAPTSCITLRAFHDVVEWGYTCTTSGEFPINTACMPWVTYDLYPHVSAFYSPATKCPTGWTAVATQTSGSQDEEWENGETAISCCPDGFQSGSRACQPVPGRTPYTATQCDDGEEDAATSTWEGAGAWPTDAKASVTILKLRFRASDVTASETGATVTGGGSSSTGSPGPSSGGNAGGGLSTGAKAAIGTVVPVVVLAVIAILFFLWRRKKQRQPLAVDKHDSAGDAPEVVPPGAGDAYAGYTYEKPDADSTGLPPQGVAVMPGAHAASGAPAPNEVDGLAVQQPHMLQSSNTPYRSEIDGLNRSEMGTEKPLQR